MYNDSAELSNNSNSNSLVFFESSSYMSKHIALTTVNFVAGLAHETYSLVSNCMDHRRRNIEIREPLLDMDDSEDDEVSEVNGQSTLDISKYSKLLAMGVPKAQMRMEGVDPSLLDTLNKENIHPSKIEVEEETQEVGWKHAFTIPFATPVNSKSMSPMGNQCNRKKNEESNMLLGGSISPINRDDSTSSTVA